MVLLIIEKGYPLDEVIFFDTGWEYQAIYKNRDKLEKILCEKDIKFTILSNDKTFDYLMFDHIINKRDGSKKKGYGWCGGSARWGTTYKKLNIRKYYKQYKEPIVEYVGIALDEQKRITHDYESIKIYPLAEWGMTEKDCLKYCFDNGWSWKEDGVELYEVLDRVSCWCCRNKNLKELKNMKQHLPKTFEKLIDLEDKIGECMKKKCSLKELE